MFRIFSDHKALFNIGKPGDHWARDQLCLEYPVAFDLTLECREVSANGTVDLLTQLPQPATEHNLRGASRFRPVDGEIIPLVRVCGLHAPFIPVADIVFGGLMTQPDRPVFRGLP